MPKPEAIDWVLAFGVVFVAAMLIGGCYPAPASDRYYRETLRVGELAEGAIYLRDASGRCLEIERRVKTGGTEYTQAGDISVYVVSDEVCDTRGAVQAPAPVEK